MRPKPEHCRGCHYEARGTGFVPPEGTGANGVALVCEAAGEQEANLGRPLVGRAGFAFNRMLLRGDLDRDSFRIYTGVVWCRPPGNETPRPEAIGHCTPLLDADLALTAPKVIVAAGDVAFRRLLPDAPHKLAITAARGYLFWSDRYKAWVLPTYHPAYILRGKSNLEAVFIHDLQRAVEIAKEGFAYVEPDAALLDPTPAGALAWAERFLREADPASVRLSVDIETPGKDADEEDLDLDANETPDYAILRCGYSWGGGGAHGENVLSLPWGGPYAPIHAKLLAAPHQQTYWNASYDVPRLRAAGMVLGGSQVDAMVSWHVLNSDLPKGLGFVTTFFVPTAAWKHLSSLRPAFYNGKDAWTADRNMLAIEPKLHQTGLWTVYQEQILDLAPVLADMSRAGMPIDPERRRESATRLTAELTRVTDEMQQVVPRELRKCSPAAGYVKPPEDTTGLEEVDFPGQPVARCSACGVANPRKDHFKTYVRKVNPCAGAEKRVTTEVVTRWAKVLPFTPSPQQILEYQALRKHAPIKRRTKQGWKVTTDIKALKTLQAKYPLDPLYPLIVEHRTLIKLAGTYIGRVDAQGHVVGGFPVGRDGRVHTTFTSDPSTLRLSSKAPNLQNVPRSRTSDWAPHVKRMFVAPEGSEFVAADFKGIEAVIVGLECGSPRYTRLAKLGVHDYFNAAILQGAGAIATVPDLSWSDDDLRACFADLKDRFPAERDVAKRVVHLSNYAGTPKRMWLEYPETFRDEAHAAYYQSLYFDVFSEIPRWHQRVLEQVDRTGYLRCADGFVHRFYEALEWSKRHDGSWESRFGDDAKRVIAFAPQHMAAKIMKRALVRLYRDPLVRPTLRLTVHDEILAEVRASWADEVLARIVRTMEAPVEDYPLDPSWGMGSYLVIAVEPKRGRSWDAMK